MYNESTNQRSVLGEYGEMINQKGTVLCIYEILKKYTDENHRITTEEIKKKLKMIYDVDMERRAVYRNIDTLRCMGIEIQGYQENHEGYCLLDRDFELSEIRLLCDAVASSFMIKPDAGKKMIRKLIDTQSVFQGRMLQKTVYIKPEKKMLNKQLFYNIDTLNLAINQGCMVQVCMLKYGFDSELTDAGGEKVTFSPYSTMWVQGNYYIVAKPDHSDELTHYRIDLMKDIVILDRGIDMIFGGFHPTQYAEKYIYLNGEKKERFEFVCRPEIWQNVAETFGRDAVILERTGEKIRIRVMTIHSKMKKWVLENLTECDLLAPEYFYNEIQQYAAEAYRKYWT